jgi:hypothetical protein
MQTHIKDQCKLRVISKKKVHRMLFGEGGGVTFMYGKTHELRIACLKALHITRSPVRAVLFVSGDQGSKDLPEKPAQRQPVWGADDCQGKRSWFGHSGKIQLRTLIFVCRVMQM